MAVIQKIRERYAKVAGAVIGLSLVAFIVSEGVNGTFGNLFGHDSNVASVDGQGIDAREYATMTREYQGLSDVFRRGQPMTEAEQAKLRQDVLEQMIVEKITDKECDKLGIVVSDAEVKDAIYGQQPDQYVQQFFTTILQQQFDPRMVKEFESEVKKTDNPKLAEAGVQWEALKRFVIRGRRLQKYNALIAQSIYTPRVMVSQNNKVADMQAAFRFVKLPLTLIPDAKAPVTDADLRDYMARHKGQFETSEPSRSIEYVTYDVVPDAADTGRALGVLQKLRDTFAASTSNELFVNRNSEERFNPVYVTRSRYTGLMADTIFKGNVGSITGPYFEANNYKMVKVVGRKEMPDSVKAQHILIATQSQQNPQGLTDTVAHQRADSLLKAIRAGANFDTLAAKFSDDPGSKVKGGDLGYFGYGRMVPGFNDSAFAGKTGDIIEVKTQYGWHIIHITDQKAFTPALQLATITKSLNIGDKANQAQFAKASVFAGANRDAKAFDDAVRKEVLPKKVADNLHPGDQVIEGLNSAREVVRWAYAAKVGDVSDPIHLENRYVVAKLAAINEPGMPVLDAQKKAQIEAVVRAEKKVRMLAEQYKSATSLDALAQQSGQQVMTADSVSGTAAFTQGLGFEPKVVGYAFYEKLQPGAVSPPIKGHDGVFFISLIRRASLNKPVDPQAVKMQAQMADQQTKGQVAQGVSEVQRKMHKVTYNPQNI